MNVIAEVIRHAAPGSGADPLDLFFQQLSRARSGRRAKALAKDFYHGMALTGHPYAQGDHATFLFHAPKARQVYLAGDFNGWNGQTERLAPVAETGLFLLRRPLRGQAAYKFVVDGRWIQDPANPRSRPDGYGGRNSIFLPGEGPHLTMHPDFYSRYLRNRRPLTLYLPPGYFTSSERYPTVYIMDGRENLERGRLHELFDGEIRAGRLPPLIAVFIPHRGRRRDHEYTPYFKRSRLDAFHRFVALELVPFIDHAFRTRPDRDARVLLGQSFGGTVVTSLAARAPQLFRHVLAQSGVYAWGRRSVARLYAEGPVHDLRLYLDCVANRTEQTQSRLLVRILETRGYPYFYRALPSRHEYEDWRERVVDGLRFLWFGIRPGG